MGNLSLKKTLNASRPSEHPLVRGKHVKTFSLGGIIGCKYKTSSRNLNGFPDGSMYVCMVITYSRVWINRVRLPILLVVSWTTV